MKKLFLGLLLTQIQTPMGTLPTTNPLFSPSSRVTFQQVPIPQNFEYSCAGSSQYTPICASYVELVMLNDPKVDAILTKYNVKVVDGGGNALFPRP